MSAALTSNRKFGLSTETTVGVLLGGNSSERRISLRSGKAVIKAFRAAGVKVLAIDTADKALARRKLKLIDVAFIALHGAGGEDGVIQKVLEKEGIPYTGSNSQSSRNAFDKVRAKKIFLKHKIPTPAYRIVSLQNWQRQLSRLGLPAFAKPIADGSSVGAFPILDPDQCRSKMIAELGRFHSLLVERKIEGREFTVGILGNSALPVIEMVSKRVFFDYRAKYTPGMTRYDVPANISKQLSKRLSRIAMQAHRALKLRDLSRVDLMVDHAGNIYVLEANSIPGMTEMSLLPKAARAAGLSFESFCIQLIQQAVKRNGTH